MLNKIISIVGPTGVGKTSWALKLTDWLLDLFAENQLPRVGVDLISADSRQVYRDLKIISGADVPVDFVENSSLEPTEHYFAQGKISLYGLSMLPYSAEWSVSHFRDFAQQVIANSLSQNRLPIVIGGTGLYHEHLFNPSPILDVRPNLKLRQELCADTVPQLQQYLQKLAPTQLEKMNHSDVNNPTRLTRAIELALWQSKPRVVPNLALVREKKLPELRQLTIGLSDDLEKIKAKIAERVAERFAHGAMREVEKLADSMQEIGPNKQLLSATGVREMQAYLNGEVEGSEMLAQWSLREFQYAKRQLTWWKKRQNVHWFKVGQPNWYDEAKQLVAEFILQ